MQTEKLLLISLLTCAGIGGMSAIGASSTRTLIGVAGSASVAAMTRHSDTPVLNSDSQAAGASIVRTVRATKANGAHSGARGVLPGPFDYYYTGVFGSRTHKGAISLSHSGATVRLSLSRGIGGFIFKAKNTPLLTHVLSQLDRSRGVDVGSPATFDVGTRRARPLSRIESGKRYVLAHDNTVGEIDYTTAGSHARFYENVGNGRLRKAWVTNAAESHFLQIEQDSEAPHLWRLTARIDGQPEFKRKVDEVRAHEFAALLGPDFELEATADGIAFSRNGATEVFQKETKKVFDEGTFLEDERRVERLFDNDGELTQARLSSDRGDNLVLERSAGQWLAKVKQPLSTHEMPVSEHAAQAFSDFFPTDDSNFHIYANDGVIELYRSRGEFSQKVNTSQKAFSDGTWEQSVVLDREPTSGTASVQTERLAPNGEHTVRIEERGYLAFLQSRGERKHGTGGLRVERNELGGVDIVHDDFGGAVFRTDSPIGFETYGFWDEVSEQFSNAGRKTERLQDELNRTDFVQVVSRPKGSGRSYELVYRHEGEEKRLTSNTPLTRTPYLRQALRNR